MFGVALSITPYAVIIQPSYAILESITTGKPSYVSLALTLITVTFEHQHSSLRSDKGRGFNTNGIEFTTIFL